MGDRPYRNTKGLWVRSIELPPDPTTGRRRRKYVTAKTIAALNEKLRPLLVELADAGDLRTAVPTVERYMRRWLTRTAKPTLKPRTYSTYETYVYRHIVPAIGRKRLDALRPSDMATLSEAIRAKGLSSTTARQAHAIMQAALRDAMREGLVRSNVAEVARKPAKAISARPSLSATDAVRVLRSADGTARLRLAVALLLGVRQGEALGLQWDHITFERDEDGRIVGGVVELAWALHRLAADVDALPDGMEGERISGGLWLLRPKTAGSWRRVPLPASLAGALHAAWEAAPAGSRFVFTAPRGGPVEPRGDARAWRGALEAAGVEHVPLHSARHTTATLLHALGVDEQTRMQILGHSSATTTRGYTHVDLTLARAGIDALAGLLDA